MRTMTQHLPPADELAGRIAEQRDDLVALRRDLLEGLQRLRDLAGRPVVITSGYRNKSHNDRVGGSPTSRHLTGEAADIKIAGLHPDEVAQLAREAGFTGIGIYKNFLHVDVRPEPVTWRG